jgi:hypothetical protein
MHGLPQIPFALRPAIATAVSFELAMHTPFLSH